MMLGARQVQVLRVLRDNGGRRWLLAADVARLIEQQRDRACTVAQARSALDALCHRISNPGPGARANRAALVETGSWPDGPVYRLTPSGHTVAADLRGRG